MSLLKIDKVKKYYGDRLILDINRFELNEGEKIGIVGQNGVGKTTLLKILIGIEEVDEGTVYLTDSYSYISQGEEYTEVTNNKFKSVFKSPNQYEEFLSGGEKVKIKVSKTLSENKKLIIADEPTSNLDVKSIETLEDMFKSFNGAILLVSHDREFLDSVCNTIVEIERGKLKVYKGNYTKYLTLKDEQVKKEETEYTKYILEKKRLEEAMVKKSEAKDSIRKTPKRMGNSEARLHKMGGQKQKKKLDNNIKALQSRIEHLEVKEKPKINKETKIEIQKGLEIYSKNLIQVKDLDLFAGEKLLIKKGSFKIKKSKKIALIGENAAGKSTLLKEIIKGNNEKISMVSNLVIGYFDQQQDILDKSKSILENLLYDSSYEESFIRIKLDRFGFDKDDVYKKVDVISGGERVKVALIKTILSDNNFLILDEPTNYLDIRAIEALETSLIDTDKTVLIVSHDRDFISHTCDYILEIENRTIIGFDGTYKEYIKNKNQPKLNKSDKEIKENLMLLENQMSKIISLLSITRDLNEKEELNKSYLELLAKIKAIKNK